MSDKVIISIKEKIDSTLKYKSLDDKPDIINIANAKKYILCGERTNDIFKSENIKAIIVKI